MSQPIDLRRQRTAAILQLRLDGAEPWDIAAFISGKEQLAEPPWMIADGERPFTAAQVAAIIKAADQAIAESYPDDLPDIARHKAKLKNLYARAVQTGDVRTARSILNDLAKIDGLNRRKPRPPPMPSKASEATAKLRAKLQRKRMGKEKHHATRKTSKAGSKSHSDGELSSGPPQRERPDPAGGDPATPETPLKIGPASMGPAD